jgi:hypothetical protein
MNQRFILYSLFFCLSTYGFSQNKNDDSLSKLLQKKRDFNKESKHGYCIQLYNGNEKSAISIMQEFNEKYPEISTKRIYKVPEWKVQTTSFKSKIDADKILNQIRLDYPGARVL